MCAKSILLTDIACKAQILQTYKVEEKFEKYLCENMERELRSIRRLLHTSKQQDSIFQVSLSFR